MNEQKKQNKQALRIGSFSIIISVVVLAIVIAANLLVSSLPGWIIRPDTTAEGMFTISDTTKEIVDAWKLDIISVSCHPTGKRRSHRTGNSAKIRRSQFSYQSNRN